MKKIMLLLTSVILIFVTSIAYSALATSLAITSEVKFRPLADIRINSIQLNGASGGLLAYESDFSKNTVSNGFTLPTAGSSISYRVHIDNSGDVDYSIYDILKATSDTGLNVSVSGYNVTDIIPAKTSVDLVLTYTTTSPGQNVINVVNTMDFKKVYHITYETGTSQIIPAQVKYEGVNLTLTAEKPIKNGYTFTKWNTKTNGTGVNYNSGSVYSLDENKTLYAQYNLNTYNINYVMNGGTNPSINPITFTVESPDIMLANATKDGYEFKGWTGNGTTTATKNLVLPTGSYGDKTFTAVFADETAPTIEVTNQDKSVNYLTTAYTVNTAWDTNSAAPTVYIDAQDVGGGVEKIEYVYSTTTAVPTTGWTETTNGALTVNKTFGKYYLHVRAIDKEGNSTTVTTKIINVRYRVAYYDDYSKSTSVSTNQYYSYGDAALTTRTPDAVDGYTFDGWYNSSALTTKVVNANASYTPTTSIKLFGKWTPINYAITYAMNNGTNNVNNPNSYNTESAAITLAAPTKTLTFKGNYNATSGVNAASGSGVTIGSNTTQAQTFKGWTGSNGTTAQTSVTITSGSTGDKNYTAHWTAVAGTLPTVTREGYTCGWSTSSTGTTITYASGAEFPTSAITETMAATVNLYAVCNPNTYQLTINPNGGTYNSTTSNTTKTMTYDSSTNNDIGTPTRSGYTFDGWYIETNSKTNQLFDNTGKNTALTGYFSAAYSTGVWKKTSVVTVYAHWSKAVSATTNTVSPTSYIYDGSAKSPTTTVKDGSTTLTSGTDYTVAFTNNTNVGTATATITGKNVYNATTKAYYTGSTTVSYYINNAKITWDANDCGTISGTSPAYVKKGATGVYTGIRNTTAGTVPTVSQAGYSFNGWYDGTTKVINADGTIVASVANWTDASKNWLITADKTLKASCTREDYSITYAMNNGTNNVNNPNSYNTESAAITLAAPTKTLTFKGNYNATSGANAASGSGVTIGSNTTQAQTFKGWTGSNGTTAQTSVTIASGSTGDKNYTAHWTAVAGTVPTVTREGYTCGWSTSSTGTTITYASGAEFPISAITEEMAATVNLYAVCNPNTYTISYTLNGGPNPSTKPTSGTYDSDVVISNPGNKTVTITGNVNGTGATVGAATTGTQTFSGWTSTTVGSNAKTGTSANPSTAWTGTSTKNTYFKNLRETGTVTMIASWSGTVKLPTLSKTGYTCKWYTAATDGSEMGASGATWTIPSNSSTSVTAYARCTANSYTLTINPNGGSYNGTTSNTTVTQNYGTTYSVSNNPTKEGYTFTGWTLSGSGTYTYYDTSVTPVVTETLNYNSASSTLPTAYNNSGGGTVTRSMVADSTATGGYSLQIVTNGVASPGAGGIYFNLWPTVASRINVLEVKAKIPSGYNLSLAGISASYTGYGSSWRTSDNAGTGEWKTYYLTVFEGAEGTLGQRVYLYVNGSNNQSVTWNVNSISVKSYTADQFKTIYQFGAGDGTLTAQWGARGVNVTWDKQGGTFGNGTIGDKWTATSANFTYLTTYANTKTAPYYISDDSYAIYKTGYRFGGWYTGQNGTGTQVFDSEGKLNADVSGYSNASRVWQKYDSNVTLYAYWISNKYTVTYNTVENGGTGTIPSASVAFGSSIDLTPTATKSGWTFVGWNTDKTATVALSSLTMGTDDVTLYAIYKKEAVTLTASWDANNATLSSTTAGTCELAAVYNNATQATSCTVTPPTITRANYNVIGWNTSASSTTNNANYNASTNKLTISANGTWYAITSAQSALTATFVNNNGATVSTTTASCYLAGSATSCQVTVPTVTPQSGFTLIGFNTSKTATTNNSNYSTSTGKLTLTNSGTWYPITRSSSQYTGTFNVQDTDAATASGGTLSCYRYNGATDCGIKAPTLTAQSGYTVVGWDKIATSQTAAYASGANITIDANTTFYSITYYNTTVTITFNRNTTNSKAISQTLNGGTASTDATVTASCNKMNGSTSCSVTSPTMEVMTGYHAVGYATSASATTSSWDVNTQKNVSSNATYYAITAGNTYSIKFNANCPTTASGSMSNLSMTYGVAKKLTANGFSCDTRVFDGWALNADGTGTSFEDQESVSNLTTTDGATVNLYAKWRLAPPSPIIGGGATKIYGTTSTTLTCTESTSYSAAGVEKYYAFGYATEENGTPSNWSDASTSNTRSIAADAFIGKRYYSCRVYASNGTDVSDTVVSSNTTTMTINNAKITFDAGNCGTVSGTNPGYVNKSMTGVYTGIGNTTVGTIPTTNKAGYTFTGWYDGTTKVINSDKSIVVSVANWTDSNGKWLLTSDKTLTANCTRDDYTITYAMNNGTNSSSNPTTYHVESSDITLVAPTKKLTFVGHVNATSGANAASGQVSIAGSTTKSQIFAGWSGTGLTENQTIVTIPTGSYGNRTYTAHWTAVSGTLPTVTRTGYTCGWNTSSTGTTITYASGGLFPTSAITEGMAATVNLYAVCKPNTYTVSFNVNGGGGSGYQTANVTATYDSAMPAISTTKPTRLGYVFDGWYDTDADTGGTQYYTANGASARNWNKASDTTLYARWTLNTYTVSFNVNGGSGSGYQTADVTAVYGLEMPEISSTQPTKTGYTFGGWYDTSAATGGTQYYTAAGASARNWDKSANTTLYARWTPTIYTLNLNKQEGSDGADVVYAKYNTGYYSDSVATTQITTSANPIIIPTKSGYTFGGYYTGEYGTGTLIIDENGYLASGISNTLFTGNADLYAYWYGGLEKAIFNYNVNQRFEAWTMLDTYYAPDWSKSFDIDITFTPSTSGKRYLLLGNYDASATNAFQLEITTGNKARVYIGKGSVDASFGSIAIGSANILHATYDGTTKEFTATITGGGSGSWSGTLSNLTGTAARNLRIGNLDYREGDASSYPFSTNITITNFVISEHFTSPLDTAITVPDPAAYYRLFNGWTGYNGETPQYGLTVPEGTSRTVTYNANWTDESSDYSHKLYTSGTGSTSNTYVKYKFQVEISYIDKARRTAYTQLALTFWRTNTGQTTSGSCTLTVSFNGVSYSKSSFTASITSSQTNLWTRSWNNRSNTFTEVLYDDDGTKTVEFALTKFSHSQFSITGGVPQIRTFTLPPID